MLFALVNKNQQRFFLYDFIWICSDNHAVITDRKFFRKAFAIMFPIIFCHVTIWGFSCSKRSFAVGIVSIATCANASNRWKRGNLAQYNGFQSNGAEGYQRLLDPMIASSKPEL